MAEIKKDCYWYDDAAKSKCGVLRELVCKDKYKCSFFETDEVFKARQKRFEEISGMTQKMKQCSHCRKVKNLAEFGSKAASADGLDCYCRTCIKDMAKIRYRRKEQRK